MFNTLSINGKTFNRLFLLLLCFDCEEAKKVYFGQHLTEKFCFVFKNNRRLPTKTLKFDVCFYGKEMPCSELQTTC